MFPVVGKPSSGKQGADVQLIRTLQEAKRYINVFFNKYREISTGLIFQKYIEVEKEFRVLVLDGKSLGVVEKTAVPNTIVRNAHKGSRFLAVSNELVETFALKYASKKGLVGVDVAVTIDNEYFLIESNRAPQWQAFEEATGISVADEIMKILEKRIAVSSELF
jgi:glutathione synthase/RimK-type ligase-like ATP-grasp enzyme